MSQTEVYVYDSGDTRDKRDTGCVGGDYLFMGGLSAPENEERSR